MPTLTLRPIAHPANAAPGVTEPVGAKIRPANQEPSKARAGDVRWLALRLGISDAETWRLLEADLAEIRAEIAGLAAGWPKRERTNLINAVKARRRSAPFRNRAEELKAFREAAKVRS